MNNRKRTALCLLGAALCVFMTFGAALALGRYPITPAALLAGDAMAVASSRAVILAIFMDLLPSYNKKYRCIFKTTTVLYQILW